MGPRFKVSSERPEKPGHRINLLTEVHNNNFPGQTADKDIL